MNYLFYNPSARNGKAAEDLQLIKKTLDGQDVEIYAVTDIDDYVSVIDKIQPEDIVYIVGGDGTLNRFINDSTNLRILGDIFFYPAGTGNDFKHDVDPDNSLYRIRLNDYIRNLPTVTVGGVTYKFVNGIGFGIDGFFMYAKSQKADLFFSGRYIRCIQCNGYPDLIRLIHSCAKSYQCFDIQLPGMDQTDCKIFNLPLQAHFISVCDIFQIQSFLKRKFYSKAADNPTLFPHIKHICFQISGEDPFSVC